MWHYSRLRPVMDAREYPHARQEQGPSLAPSDLIAPGLTEAPTLENGAMKKSPKFSPEVRERAVRMVQEHRGEHPSQWAAIEAIAGMIGCVPQTLHDLLGFFEPVIPVRRPG